MNTIVARQALEQRSMNIDNRLTRHNNNCTSKHTCYNNSYSSNNIIKRGEFSITYVGFQGLTTSYLQRILPMELQLYCTYVLMQYMCKGISSGDFVVRVGEYLSTQTTTIGRIHSSSFPHTS